MSGFLNSPFKQYKIRVKPQSMELLNYPYQAISILANNLPQDVYFRFAGSGQFTQMEAGLGYGFDKTVEDLQIKNESETEEAIVTVLLAIGDIKDNRMVVTGAVRVYSNSDENVNILPKKLKVAQTPVELVIAENGSLTIDPSAFAFCRLQNISTNNMRLYAQTGFVLSPLGVEEMQLKEPFVVYGNAGDKLVFGGFN